MVKDLRSSHYIPSRTNESFSRIILDLVFVDRLNHLQDEAAHKKLLLGTEVSLAIETNDDMGKRTMIKGRADWALGYGSSKTNTGSILIIAEAKRVENASVGMPQMLIYMAAVREARGNRENKTVWGILSDSSEFYFACLKDDGKLLTSPPFAWRFHQSDILRYIDTMLRDAMQSSPHTTPIKVKNSNLLGYGRYLVGNWKFGEESEEDEDEQDDSELPFVDVIERDDHIFLRERRVLTDLFER